MGKILKGSRLPTHNRRTVGGGATHIRNPSPHTHTVSESSAFHNRKSEGEERVGGPAAPGVHRTA
jgi:hypothetical protein